MDLLKDILDDLYNGRININEKSPKSQEYSILEKEAKEILKSIESKIDATTKDLLNEYIEKKSQIISIDCEEKFIDGYKLASKLIIAGLK